MYDLIIVGGGPAGATAARYLAQGGRKVLLLEKDLTFKKPCGGGIRMDAFDEFGLDRDIVDKVVDEILLESRHSTVSFDISHTPLGIVERSKFDTYLRQKAANAGASILEAKVVGLELHDASVSVRVKTVKGYARYEAEYLIASDGVFSTVRQKMRGEKVPRYPTPYTDLGTMSTEKCHFYFDPAVSDGAYGWRFPYKAGSDIGTMGRRHGKTELSRLLGLMGVENSYRVKGYAIPVWEKPLFYDRRVFYVGDAAGQVSPFTFEGIYYAMKSAKILAGTILEHASPEVYRERWHTLYFKKFTVLKKLQRIFLYNLFTISVMMRLLESPSVQRKLLDLWMDRYEVQIDMHFVMKVLKRTIFRKKAVSGKQ